MLYIVVNAETGSFSDFRYAGTDGRPETREYTMNRTLHWCENVENAGRHVAPVEFDDFFGSQHEVMMIRKEISDYQPTHRAKHKAPNLPRTERI